MTSITNPYINEIVVDSIYNFLRNINSLYNNRFAICKNTLSHIFLSPQTAIEVDNLNFKVLIIISILLLKYQSGFSIFPLYE